MDWKEATDLGQEASWLIGKLQRVFDRITEGGYLVEPPTWKKDERIEQDSEFGAMKVRNVLVLDSHLTVSKVFEPIPLDEPPPPKPEGPPTEEVHLGGKIRPNSNRGGG